MRFATLCSLLALTTFGLGETCATAQGMPLPSGTSVPVPKRPAPRNDTPPSMKSPKASAPRAGRAKSPPVGNCREPPGKSIASTICGPTPGT